jgi:single-strand DNA-binding protein
MNYNKVIVAGFIVRDPELKKTTGGQSVCSFTVASNRSWTDKSGEKKALAEFHAIVAWGKTGELVHRYMKKASVILVEGHLQTRSWDDQNGIKRNRTEIVAEVVQFGSAPRENKPVVEESAPIPTEEPAEAEMNIDDIPF